MNANNYDEISKWQKWAEICYSINKCRSNEKSCKIFRFKVLLTLFNYWRLMGRCAADWRHSLHFGKFQLHLRRVLARHCNATQVFQDFFSLKSNFWFRYCIHHITSGHTLWKVQQNFYDLILNLVLLEDWIPFPCCSSSAGRSCCSCCCSTKIRLTRPEREECLPPR